MEQLSRPMSDGQSACLHADVCQNQCRYFTVFINLLTQLSVYSTLRQAILKEHVKAMLMKNIRQGLAFGDFVLTEFSDPILQEHVVSVTVSDMPKDLQV